MKVPSINKVAWIIALPIISYGIFHIVITLAVSKMGIALDPPAEMGWDDYQDWIRSGAWFREALWRGLSCILLPLLAVFVLNVVTNPQLAPVANYVRNSARQMMRLLCSPAKLIPILCGSVLLLFVLGQIFVLPASILGGVVAHFDILRGRTKIKCCGLPSPNVSIYRKLLQTQYGVEREQIAGCIVTTWQIGYSYGYNSVSKKRIQRKFKKDYLFEEVSCLAQRMREDSSRGSKPVRTWDGFVIPEATLKRTSTDPSFGYTLSNPVKLNGGAKGENVMVYLGRLRDDSFERFTITHPKRFRADKNGHFVERYTLTGHQGNFQIFIDPQHAEIKEDDWMAPTGMWLDLGVTP